MTDLAWLVAGSVAPAALGFLVVCWRDQCSRQVPVTDELGLCDEHLEELQDREPKA